MTSIESFSTYHEIKSQTDAWAQAINLASTASLPAAENYDQVLFTGCGSTYYLSLAAAALYQELTGRPARAVPAGELLFNPRTSISEGLNCLLVATSRSGTTTETVRAVERFKANKWGDVAVISTNGEVLAGLADGLILVSKGQEVTVPQTRSFSSMYLASVGFCARMAKRKDLIRQMESLPETGSRLVRDFENTARILGENLDFDRIYFLGSGIRYGLACEANLKMKEMTLTHSEAFHFLEFRHGPMSMVNSQALVIGLASETNFTREMNVLSEMRQLGGETLSMGEADVDIAFASGITESLRGVLYLPVLQLISFYRSLKKGLNPDHPKNLTAVIKLDL